jgi:Copper type II ascorbate-dependent monooxygenase, N-terminal domain/Secretion system C-terminal sorting domain
MKKALLLIFSIVSLSQTTFSQTPTWAENIAPILYKNCVNCHNPKGIAPFSLLTFDEAYRNRAGIKASVISKNMPPWSPDPNYRHLANERILSNADINAITAWVNGNAPQGNLANAPTSPIFASGTEIVAPDLVLTIPIYNINTTNDLYRCFVIPSTIVGDRFITQLEVIPGNRKVVHHVLAFQDSTNVPIQMDAADPGPGYTNYGGTGSNGSTLIAGWVPGQGAMKFPKGMGIRLSSGTNLVLQVHYPGGIANQKDSTKIILKFAPVGSANRELINRPILAHVAPYLQNGPLAIPANQSKTFVERLIIPREGSFLSIAPHMHLIGRRTKVYGLMPNGDTLRLINIPDWDFNWQGAYGFRNVMKFPAGMTLVAESHYDNTTANPYNPSSPPKAVALGEGTADEMMLTYFTFMAYQPGDENIVLDSSAIISNTFDIQEKERLNLSCFPNPSRSNMTLNFTLPQREICNVDIFALNGVAVKGIFRGEWLDKGEHQLPISTADLPSGTYIVRLSSEKTYGIQQFVRIE